MRERTTRGVDLCVGYDLGVDGLVFLPGGGGGGGGR